jgi:large subunit ribosomal protein L47
MARIKAVINERRLAYEGAVKIAEQQREEHYDKVVLHHQVTQFKAERKYLQKRREYKARKEAARLKRGVGEGVQDATGVSETKVDLSPAEQVGKVAKEDPSEPLHTEPMHPEIGSVETEIPPTQPKAVDAATAGLFGDDQTSSKQRR